MPRATWKGVELASSGQTIVVEGNHYFPPDSIHADHFRPSDTHSTCGWKGEASYNHVVVDGAINRDAAWYYPTPKDAAREIAGYVAFWRGVDVQP